MTDKEIKELIAEFRVKWAAALYTSNMRPARAYELGLREGFRRGQDDAHAEAVANMKALMERRTQ